VDVVDVALVVVAGRLLSEHGAGEEAEHGAALEVGLGKELLGVALWERPLEKDVFGCCWRHGTAENDLPCFSCWIFLSVCIAWSTRSDKLLYENISTNPEISALRPWKNLAIFDSGSSQLQNESRATPSLYNNHSRTWFLVSDFIIYCEDHTDSLMVQSVFASLASSQPKYQYKHAPIQTGSLGFDSTKW
jgi:hypothetical protein